MEPTRPSAESPSHADQPNAPLPWGFITCYFLASRLYIFVIGMLSVHVIAKGQTGRSKDPLELFKNWDAFWYLDIAQDGYPAHGNSTAFFPLYPLLIHLAGFVFHDLRIAGYLISNALLLASCFLLWKLVVRDYKRPKVADRAVVFFLFCPVSFFFSTIYTESLFFFLMLALTFLAKERCWLAAGCCGYLAALTRPVGILLIAVLAAEFVVSVIAYQKIARPNRPPVTRLPRDTPSFVASLFLTVAGLATYCFYLANRFGNPLKFLEAEKHWNRQLAFPWVPFERFYYLAFYDVWFYAAASIALVLLILGFVFRLRASHSILGGIYFLFYFCTTQLESIPRFLSILFPFYITLGMGAVRWPRLEPLLLAGSAMLLTLSIVLFVNGYWFT